MIHVEKKLHVSLILGPQQFGLNSIRTWAHKEVRDTQGLVGSADMVVGHLLNGRKCNSNISQCHSCHFKTMMMM